MTNGNVDARVDNVTGPKLTFSYKGGQQTILVDPKTPIVAFAAGSRSDLRPGAAVIVHGARENDGSIDAVAVLVGKDSVVPPM